MTQPTRIKLDNKETLLIEWDDGEIYRYPLTYLRDESPDAENKGETILWREYAPPLKGPDKPGKYEIENIEIVGNYALSIKWKDGYDYGIYSYDLLRTWGKYFDTVKDLHQDFDKHSLNSEKSSD
ncbi:MAG TPA: DUF971 domain-containing protein [Ignavibacteria bacterium]|nr:DUF971 domain-containing protein [Ignavibacteria bacterium]